MGKNETIVRGFVYEASGKNEGYQVGKKGIEGVVVSNQRDVVVTDENGYFVLSYIPNNSIFVVKPSGYDLPLNEINQPRFYYLHKLETLEEHPERSESEVSSEGMLPDLLNFPLLKSKSASEFKVLFTGDIQTKTELELSYFQKIVVREMMAHEIDFLVPLGDIAWDDLSIYPKTKQLLGKIGTPVFPVCGNHDVDFKVNSRKQATQTFQRHFGPTYYAFDYGKVHFVVLDVIGYDGWDEENDKKGPTSGKIDEQQLEWLRNDLALVPYEHLIVFLSHIPFYTDMAPEDAYRNVQNRAALFDIVRYRPHLFSLSAHTHCVEHVDLRVAGWEGMGDFSALIAGAACGAWWKGPKENDGMPTRMGVDGTPNGFFIFTFKDNGFDYDFIPADAPPSYQMRIYSVGGTDVEQPKFIYANIFAASPKATVTFSIDGKNPLNMERLTMRDPYVGDFIDRHPEDYPVWMRPRLTNHIWRALLPDNLSVGPHIIEVKAMELNGKCIKMKQILQISEKGYVDDMVIVEKEGIEIEP